jgi:hypothetical protein
VDGDDVAGPVTVWECTRLVSAASMSPGDSRQWFTGNAAKFHDYWSEQFQRLMDLVLRTSQ